MESSFKLLPEWHPQRAILMSWPHPADESWKPVYEDLNAIYTTVIKTVAMTQSVMIICHDAAHRNQVQRCLIEANVNLPRVRFFIIPSDTIWIRNYGPIALKRGEEAKILNFQTGGGANVSMERDGQVSGELYDQNFFPQAQFNSVKFMLESSAIETDGAGALLTTAHALFSQQRNSGYSQEDAGRLLKETLGVARVIWLESRAPVDAVARFVSPRTICYAAGDPALEEQLRALRNGEGLSYQLMPLPTPERARGSYTHFVMTNQAVLMPFYDEPSDSIAKNMLQSAFPGQEVIGISCDSLTENGGNLHGITMQVPK